MDRGTRQRATSRSRSPPPWRRVNNGHRFDRDTDRADRYGDQGHLRGRGRGHANFQNPHQRRNQEQEDRQMRDWMSKEDDFVLKQSKKKAKIRINEGRAKPIDQLVLILSILDPSKDLLEDDLDPLSLEVKSPASILEGLALSELEDIEKEIEHYLVLEHTEVNRTFWQALKTICRHKVKALSIQRRDGGIASVSTDIDRLLSPKTLQQLQTLESQVYQKLKSDEAIDEEYWDQLLDSIIFYKAKAHLDHFIEQINATRLKVYRAGQIAEARRWQASPNKGMSLESTTAYPDTHDPTPQLRVRPEDQGLEAITEYGFRERMSQARLKVLQAGYVDTKPQRSSLPAARGSSTREKTTTPYEDQSSVTAMMVSGEAAKGMEEDEEAFGDDDEIALESKTVPPENHRLRKPKHFNRVQMGYEWNKYNQTHYDHENPPPKVVQGYKFNVFYPELLDKSKAPTYKIERENGRKKGQSLAPAGEEDICIIKFISGPPYQDIAFRIVDREWDYSAKYERGFKSSFDKGVLQLHFQFKKIYYRK